MKDKRLLIIFLTVFIDLVGFGIIIPMNPYLAEAYGASGWQVGLLMSVYSCMQFFFSPVWGSLSDRIGRRPVILISLLGASLSHLGFAFASTYWALILARSLAGVFGGNISAAMAYIADITPEKDRSKGMGLIGAAFGLGFILGPALGGVGAIVGKHLGSTAPVGEHFPALLASLICLLNFFFALKFLHESRNVQLASVAQVPPPAQRFIQLFVRIGRAFRTPVLDVLIGLLFLNTFALSAVEAYLFLYVNTKFSWTMAQASLGFAYIGIIMVITQGYLIRKFMPKYGERNLLIAGFLLCAVGFALCSGASGVPILGLGVTAMGFGYGLASPSITGCVSLVSGKDVQGNNLGVSQGLSSLARILGPVTGGWLYDFYGPWSPFALASVVTAVGFLIALNVRRRLPEVGKAFA